ncbi:uncharacterized protein TNCV_4760231 [Trichonephila clavipes]|uniref:Uncharacterized protein n=1 Tax=Trichonephila clavipes TaxID=2585209 RepID=A0A8X6RIZ6_TRICX|nr:uncharacterized protein TNCV_4760231 [Trichonephila clavipes]
MDATEYVGGNIEKLFDEARQNMRKQHIRRGKNIIIEKGERVELGKKSRRSRKPSSKSCKSNKGTARLEDLKFKRKVVSTGTVERKAPVLPQGIKRGVTSSISSITRKYVKTSFHEYLLHEPETIAGPANQQQMKKFSPTTEESRRGARVQSDKARETRTTGSKRHSAAEGRPVRPGKTITVIPCPYYIRSRF